MNLTLEVISANGSGLGAGRRKLFGAEGGRIGRAADCDWVLPSPQKFVSRHHATILFKYGRFYVKAEGENGVAINDPSALLAFDTPAPIKQGDRLYIDDYVILVSMPDEIRAPLIAGDPFADESDADSPLSTTDAREDDSLDPLCQLPGAPARASGHGYVELPPGDILSDPFVPPPPTAPIGPPPAKAATGTAHMAIPTDPDAWNRTIYGGTTYERDQPAPRPQSKASITPAPREPTRQIPRSSPPHVPTPPPAPSPRLSNAALRQTAATVPDAPSVQPLPPTRRTPQPAQMAAPSAGFDVDAMLRAAGVDPQSVSREMAATLGEILLVVVQGTIDALRARDDVKSQFRLPVTRVQVENNNPLTFAIDAADAVNSLFNRRNQAFLPPLDAFQRAFDDIRDHQMAMVAGMRAGFEGLMARFDPEHLQEDFDKQAKRSGLIGVGKPKYWDMYGDFFAGLRGDRDDAFHRLFGEEFALAYQKQAELIKRSRGKKSP